ncbi:MAG TPA: hypothetical protein VNF91_02150 [Candidatus Acidoferrum sp.]|nr:hypothetical protein [Candidatus Acidoferrum sp.]
MSVEIADSSISFGVLYQRLEPFRQLLERLQQGGVSGADEGDQPRGALRVGYAALVLNPLG